MVQSALDSGTYAGAIWIEGSPSVEESAYWLSLLIDTRVPISCNASQRAHGALANDGDHNIVDSVEYIVSRAWADHDGDDRVGAVMCQDGQIFAAREVQKADARPGGYIATGGHGGILGRIGEAFPPTPTRLTFVPTRRHTAGSDVNVRQLPASVWGVVRNAAALEPVSVPIKAATGDLLPTAIPKVSIIKEAQQFGGDAAIDDGSRSPATEVDILAHIAHNLEHAPLAGFVGEGMSPYGLLSEAADAALRQAVFSGMPVVKVGRGNNEGFTSQAPPFLSGNNLTASKARLLLMACLMKFGSLPIARDVGQPTERNSLRRWPAWRSTRPCSTHTEPWSPASGSSEVQGTASPSCVATDVCPDRYAWRWTDMPGQPEGKVALVTSAASGIGRATAP